MTVGCTKSRGSSHLQSTGISEQDVEEKIGTIMFFD
jgi:hypothetical protein